MSDRPLADSQKRILILLLENGPMTPNELGRKISGGRSAHGNHGQGNVRRRMGPAVFATPALTGLRKRGLTRDTRRTTPSGYTVYEEKLTPEGQQKAEQLDGERD